MLTAVYKLCIAVDGMCLQGSVTGTASPRSCPSTHMDLLNQGHTHNTIPTLTATDKPDKVKGTEPTQESIKAVTSFKINLLEIFQIKLNPITSFLVLQHMPLTRRSLEYLLCCYTSALLHTSIHGATLKKLISGYGTCLDLLHTNRILLTPAVSSWLPSAWSFKNCL